MISKRPYSEKDAIKVLFDPLEKGLNRICILSDNATPSMASWLLTSYKENNISDIVIELIVASTAKEGINSVAHEGFKELHGNRYTNNNIKFSCSYLFQPLDSECNLYIWLKDDRPLQAFSSTYDFCQTSLLRVGTGAISACSPDKAYKFYEQAVARSIFCNHFEIEEYVRIFSENYNPIRGDSNATSDSVSLSLLTKSGEPGTRSGLNWGQRDKRNRNEAYIPLPSRIAKSGFFPLNKQHFLAVTDDLHALQLRVEQQNDKAITTPTSNALLGEYFRNRLGLANGAYITAEDLFSYGRTDVIFYKIDDEHYFMDFSVNRNGEENDG